VPEKNYILLVVRDELIALKEVFLENKLIFLLLLGIFIGGLYFIDPIPGRRIQIAFSGADSGYALIAKDQQVYLKERGISLEPRETQSSIQSATLLTAPDSGVSAAFIQGGVLTKDLAERVESLGSVAYEPVWIFYRKDLKQHLDRFKDLATLQVGIGPKDSGTWSIARQLFALNQVNIDSSSNFKPDSYENNMIDFLAGRLDVVINVNPQIDPVVNRLLHEPSAAIFELTHAVAYDKNLPFVKVITLAASSIDIANQIPPKDVTLLATTTTLAVRKGLHPSLQIMLLMATKDAQRVSKNLFLSNEEKFPAYIDPTIPISEVATQFYDYGVPQTLRYLPFWLAGFFDRMWVFILSLLAIFYPLSYLNINLRQIRYNNGLTRTRRNLLLIERELNSRDLDLGRRHSVLNQLQEIHKEILSKRVPIDCEQDHFELMQLLEELISKAQ